MLALFCFAGYTAGDGKRLENQHWTKRIYQQSQLNDHEIDSIQVDRYVNNYNYRRIQRRITIIDINNRA